MDPNRGVAAVSGNLGAVEVMLLVGDGDWMMMVLVGHADRMVMVLVGDGDPMVTV